MSLGLPWLPFKAAKPLYKNTLRQPGNNLVRVNISIAQNEAFDLQ